MTPDKKTSPPHKTPEKRFPKAAVDYIDALLETQRTRFEKEAAHGTHTANWPTRPSCLHILAEGDNFLGSGWGMLDRAKDGTGRRWMARIGTILLPIDLSSGATVHVSGNGYLKKRFLKELTIWLDDTPLEGKLSRKGLSGWQFNGNIPKLEGRAFHILRLQTTGIRPAPHGPGTHASLAVSEIRIDGT